MWNANHDSRVGEPSIMIACDSDQLLVLHIHRTRLCNNIIWSCVSGPVLIYSGFIAQPKKQPQNPSFVYNLYMP